MGERNKRDGILNYITDSSSTCDPRQDAYGDGEFKRMSTTDKIGPKMGSTFELAQKIQNIGREIRLLFTKGLGRAVVKAIWNDQIFIRLRYKRIISLIKNIFSSELEFHRNFNFRTLILRLVY